MTVLFFKKTLIFRSSIDFLMFKMDFRRGRFSQSSELKIYHGEASLDTETYAPP